MQTKVNRDDLPKKLRRLNRWGLWRFVKDERKPNDKPRKVPLQLDGKYASATEPYHFSRLRDVLVSPLIRKKHVQGLAFALYEEDDITVFDFDNISELSSRQRKRIMRLCRLTYSEWSQSKNGVHCFFSGHDERIKRKKFMWGDIKCEVYRLDRFIAVTGDRIEDCGDDLEDYDADGVEQCLGELPDEATHDRGSVNDEIADDLMNAEPTLELDAILRAIKRDARHDTRDAGPVHDWLTDGYEGGDDRSSNDLIVCKVLWKYGAVYSQIEEVVLTHPLRDDEKWQRDDYRRSTILKAYNESTASGFDDLGKHDDEKGKSSRKKPKTIRIQMDAARKRLNETAAAYNDIILRISSGRLEDGALERNERRANKLRESCFEIAMELNNLDVVRLNQWYGEVIIGSEIRVGAYYNGKKRLMRWDTFEKVMRSQREAVAIKEAAARGRAETGKIKVERIPSADHWLAHSDHLRFPYEPELYPSPNILYTDDGFREGDGDKPYNLFEGCRFLPSNTNGDSSESKYMPIVRHIHNVWASKQRPVTEYILDWMARMVQFPHTNGQTAIVLRSIEGVGKNVITNIFKRYYGIHAVDITDMDSVRGFNAMPMRSVMVVFNEATYGGNKKTAGALKAMVTDEYLTSQEKYQPSITHRNCSHILIFSNNDWIVPVGLDDRRFLILQCDTTHMQGGEGQRYFKKLITECIEQGGDRAFIRHLLTRDISKFNPRNIPYQKINEAHMEQTIRGLTPFQSWILDSAQCGGFQLSSGVLVEWKRAAWLRMSITDLKDAFKVYAKNNGLRGAGNEVMYGVAKKLSDLLDCSVVDVDKVLNFSQSGRGRGIRLPSLKYAEQRCRLLHETRRTIRSDE